MPSKRWARVGSILALYRDMKGCQPWHQTPSPGRHGKIISLRHRTSPNDFGRQDPTEADSTIFGAVARFFRIANSGSRGVQQLSDDGICFMSNSEKIIRLKTVLARTGLSRSTLYRKIGEGTFPSQVKISIHGSGWHECAINRWIADPPGYRPDNDNCDPNAGRGHERR